MHVASIDHVNAEMTWLTVIVAMCGDSWKICEQVRQPFDCLSIKDAHAESKVYW